MANPQAKRKTNTALRQRARELLLEGKTALEVAKLIEAAPSTIYKWRNQPEFARRLSEAQENRLTLAADKLKSGVGIAIDTLIEIAGDDCQPGATRVKASCEILDRAGVTSKAAPATVMIDRRSAPTPDEMAEALRYMESQRKPANDTAAEAASGGG